MPYGGINLDQLLLCEGLVVWWHQAITWSNVVLSSVWFCDAHVRPISQEVPKISVHNISLKNIVVKLFPHFSGLIKGLAEPNTALKIRFETCRTEAQFCQDLYMVKKDSLPNWPRFCQSGSPVRHLFWRCEHNFCPTYEEDIHWSEGHYLSFHHDMEMLSTLWWLSMKLAMVNFPNKIGIFYEVSPVLLL